MADYFYANDGSVINVGDLNIYDPVGGHQWATFMTLKSDPIFARRMKDSVAGLPYPNIFGNLTQQIFEDAKAGDAATVALLENEGYWFVGDYYNGGLVFFEGPDTSHVGFACVRAMEECNNDVNNWFYWGNGNYPLTVNQVDPSDGTTKAYDNAIGFVDDIKLNGTLSNTDFYVIEGCPEIGHWDALPLPGQVVYERNNVNDSYQRTSIEGGDFVNNLVTFYQTTFMRDAVQPISYGNKYKFWKNAEKPKPDPYKPGGYSEPDGGDGTFNNNSIDIPVPGLPAETLLNCGIIKMYQPSETEMRQFMNWIYSSPQTVIDNIKKLWVNPMESIISFALSPISPSVGAAEEVKFCGVGSNISMNVIDKQYGTISCGALMDKGIISKYFGSALDFSNYCKVSLFLPFIGFVPIPSDELIGGDIAVDYNLDFLTGECVAFVTVAKTDSHQIKYNSVMHTYKGNFLAQAPVTGNNFQNLYQSVLSTVTSIGTGVASGMTGNIAGGIAGVASSIGANLLGQKVEYQRAGTMSGNGGQLGEYIPYLIVERPIQSLSSDFVDKRGYPSNICNTINNINGYFEIIPGTFHPDIQNAKDIWGITKQELDMINQLLIDGAVYNEQ